MAADDAAIVPPAGKRDGNASENMVGLS